MRSKPAPFYSGVFLIALCSLALQTIQTRVLSVVTLYSMAFFAISMAMLGMTAGALLVYVAERLFPEDKLSRRLADLSLAFGVAVVGSVIFLVNTVPVQDPSNLLLTGASWLKMILILAPPYVLSGMVLALALTRSPFPVGLTYGVDLVGAAFGCLVVLGLLFVFDGVSSLLLIGALGSVAGLCFAAGGARSGPLRWAVVAALVAFAFTNGVLFPKALKLTVVKGQIERSADAERIEWNSFSRVRVRPARHGPPHLWSVSRTAPPLPEIIERRLDIDGSASTDLYAFDGDVDALWFLDFDLTNLAYAARNEGRAAIIGVGGGRDVLAAHRAGFTDVVGVEINPIFIRLLEDTYSDFNRVASLPGVRFVVDEARSWFARTDESFDLIQMSLIDTWAATGAGAFSLSENSLYTVEGWQYFLDRLVPNGLFTVSRWYLASNPAEAGRLLSLARASLFAAGVTAPNDHIFLATNSNLCTLVISPSPLSPATLDALERRVSDMAFRILASPSVTPEDRILGGLWSAESPSALASAARASPLDVSAPTDRRPFFFNQLRLSQLGSLWSNRELLGGGVVAGNLVATLVLVVVIVLSTLVAVVVTLVPSLPSLRRSDPSLGRLGTLHFALIGLGFMFVEIGLVQRLSGFLGHPVYGLSIALFSLVLATGVGSLVSEIRPLRTRGSLTAWTIGLATFLILLAWIFPVIVKGGAAETILVRALLAIAVVLPPGFLMGFGFPTGMRLVEAIDRSPTPWFWAINGAAGVVASGLAVAVAIHVSIDVNLLLGAACYASLLPVTHRLLAASS